MSTQVEQITSQERASNAAMAGLLRRLHTGNNIAVGVIWVVAMLVALIFVVIIVDLVIQGFTARLGNTAVLLNPDFWGGTELGIASEVFNTFYILILTEIFLVPIALGAAIYLVEYARQGPLIAVIRFAAETLAGVPTIVLGLFGFILFSAEFQLHISRLAGALTLLCLNFPIALRLFEQGLTAVPRDLREGSLAMGASKWRMIRTVVLPSALPGIVTGIILSAGRIIGETAAIVFTMGETNPFSGVFTLNPLIASDTLTVHIWYLKTQDIPPGITAAEASAIAAGSAAVLIVILLVINIGARSIGRAIERRITAA
ncbi:MAG TPA: phosphate ABC transporter permease PstA [Ktedonobacteraceae bacterium]|jgi:phosphate transport system permease protein|nr:phosphate ABC transporter permease PstA [Ktedonobacteraceae bacterium]